MLTEPLGSVFIVGLGFFFLARLHFLASLPHILYGDLRVRGLCFDISQGWVWKNRLYDGHGVKTLYCRTVRCSLSVPASVVLFLVAASVLIVSVVSLVVTLK